MMCYYRPWWSNPGRGSGFYFSKRPDRFLGQTQLPSQRVRWFFCRGMKWPGPNVDHSPPSSAEIKNKWGYTCTLHIRLHVVGRHNSVRLSIWHRQLQCRENWRNGTFPNSLQTMRIKHKNHAVNAEGNARLLFWQSHKTHKYSQWA